MEVYGVIYKIFNLVNDKFYIGYAVNVEERMERHIKAMGRKSNLLINRTMKKNGLENFIFMVIDRAFSREELCKKEIHHISKYNSQVPNGYNMTPGGDGPIPKGSTKETNDTVKRSAEKQRGRTKENHPGVKAMAEKAKLRNAGNTPYIKKWVDERRGKTKETCPFVKKVSIALKGRTKETHGYLLTVSEKQKENSKKEGSQIKVLADKRRGTKLTSEWKLKIKESLKNSEAHKKAHNSPEYIEKQRLGNLGEKNPMFGKPSKNKGIPRTKEVKLKISATKFKNKYPELFTWNKELPPVTNIQNKENSFMIS